MQLDKDNLLKILGIATFTLLLAWALQNFELVGRLLGLLLGLLLPFLLGICIAFILNVPMRFIERKLPPFRHPRAQKLRRPCSLMLTLLLVCNVLVVVLFLVIPELANTFRMLKNSMPRFLGQMEVWINQLSAAIPELGAWLSTLVIDWDKLANAALSFLQNDMGNLLGSTVGVVASVFSGIFHGAMGFVFAIYLLLQKETLCRQCRKFVYAFFPMRWADSAVRVCLLSNRVFSSFLSGQCAEAVILGSMFFLAMSVTGFPYALMIGVLVGFTALIPIFGAFIGCGIGAFLIVMVSPVRAFWFIMLFLILQQLEGNFIYPKVVGGSVGLPSMWVLLAVTIGGSAMGIIGMLVFIPLVSVLYALLREAVNQRLAARALPADKLVPDAQQQAGGNQG